MEDSDIQIDLTRLQYDQLTHILDDVRSMIYQHPTGQVTVPQEDRVSMITWSPEEIKITISD